MDEKFKKMIIFDNYQNPFGKGLIDNDNYIKVKLKSKSCIDQIVLQIKFKNNIIEDAKFDGEACAICTSSTSILLKNIIGKKIDEVLDIINNFNNLIEEKDYDKNLLGDAIVYENISKQPNRKNCALMSWNGLKKIVEGKENDE